MVGVESAAVSEGFGNVTVECITLSCECIPLWLIENNHLFTIKVYCVSSFPLLVYLSNFVSFLSFPYTLHHMLSANMLKSCKGQNAIRSFIICCFVATVVSYT